MDMYKEATRQKLRFSSVRGPLSVEDLWALKLTDLNDIAVSVDNSLNNSPKKSFITTRSVANKADEIRLEILKDIIAYKQDLEAAKEAEADRKAKKEMIMQILENKKTDDLKSKSSEELEALLAKL